MTEQEAKFRCTQLAAEHPDRATTNWLPVNPRAENPWINPPPWIGGV